VNVERIPFCCCCWLLLAVITFPSFPAPKTIDKNFSSHVSTGPTNTATTAHHPQQKGQMWITGHHILRLVAAVNNKPLVWKRTIWLSSVVYRSENFPKKKGLPEHWGTKKQKVVYIPNVFEVMDEKAEAILSPLRAAVKEQVLRRSPYHKLIYCKIFLFLAIIYRCVLMLNG